MNEKVLLMEGLIDILCDMSHLQTNEVAKWMLDNNIRSLDDFIKEVYHMAGIEYNQ